MLPPIPSCVGHAFFTSMDIAANTPTTTLIIELVLVLSFYLLILQGAPDSRNWISTDSDTLKKLLGPQLIE